MKREEIHKNFNANGDIEIADALDYAIAKTEQEFELRICKNCRWYKNKVCKLYDINHGADFGCNKFEIKENK